MQRFFFFFVTRNNLFKRTASRNFIPQEYNSSVNIGFYYILAFDIVITNHKYVTRHHKSQNAFWFQNKNSQSKVIKCTINFLSRPICFCCQIQCESRHFFLIKVDFFSKNSWTFLFQFLVEKNKQSELNPIFVSFSEAFFVLTLFCKVRHYKQRNYTLSTTCKKYIFDFKVQKLWKFTTNTPEVKI